MLEELIAAVTHDTQLEPDKARLVVQSVVRFITANCSSSIVGEMHELLKPQTSNLKHIGEIEQNNDLKQ